MGYGYPGPGSEPVVRMELIGLNSQVKARPVTPSQMTLGWRTNNYPLIVVPRSSQRHCAPFMGGGSDGVLAL